MTQDEWQRAETIATQALLLPESERQHLIDTADLDGELRRQISDALHRMSKEASRPSSGPTPAPVATVQPPIVLNTGDALEGGRFVVVRQIGRGGMGTVYLAHDTMLGTLVALKVLPFDDALIAEARRAAACSHHPHVATVLNVLHTELRGVPLGVLVMEYVAGTPASRLIDDGPIDIRRALRWAQQVAGAIAHAHDHQVLHCDLKPANIIITPDDRAKVLDFGIARATFDAAGSGAPLRGTLPYMAPEQLAGEFSSAGDIYGLGVTLYELITGQRPFSGDGAALRLRILMEPPPRVSASVRGVPADLDALVERTLAKNPDHRYRSARALARDLEQLDKRLHEMPPARRAVAAIGRLLTDRRTHIAVGVLVGILGGFVVFGALTSAAYNITLERGAFADDTVSDWLLWGRRTSIPPLIASLMVVAAVAPLLVVRQVFVSMSRSFRRFDRLVAARLEGWHGKLRLGDASVLASYALLLSGAGLAGTVWYYWPLLAALLDFVSRAPAERLALLAADRVTYHNYYRGAFSFLVTFILAVWYPIIRLVAHGQRLHWGLWAAGASILVIALLFLHFPYRLMNYRNTFEVVMWDSSRCYITGERAAELLLFCPDRPSNRVQKASKTDRGLKYLGHTETNLFNAFSRVPQSSPSVK